MTIVPFIYSFDMSLHRINLAGVFPGRPFIGFSNYAKIIFDEEVRHSLWITTLFLLFAVPIEFLLGFGYALLLQQNLLGRRLLRTLFILPMATIPITAGLMFKLMYNPEFGVIGYILSKLGIFSRPVLGDMRTALAGCVVIDVWQWTPFVALIILAGLESLPIEPFEAASVDGASSWQVFKHITFPMLSPIMLIALIFRTMDTLKIFDIIYLLTFGGPGDATNVYSLQIYRIAFRTWEMGYAAANSFVLLGIAIISSTLLIRLLTAQLK